MGKDDEYSDMEEYEAGGELVDLAEQPEVDTGTSAVAVAPGSRMVVMIVVGIGVLALLYYMFFAGVEDTDKKESRATPTSAGPATPVTPDTTVGFAPPAPAVPDVPNIELPEPPAPQAPNIISIPSAPPPPQLQPVAPAPPVQESSAPTPPVIAEGESEEDRQRRIARMKSGMIIAGGGGGGGDGEAVAVAGQEGEPGALDKLLGKDKGFGKLDFKLKKTSAEQEQATLVARDMSAVVAQGKIIDAVLETAINTDIPGQLRAIISRDVYAETGKNILLPKGTRLIGNYQSEVKRGEKRIQIVWTRAIRPDGIDIAIESPGTDQLGRSGIDGTVDNRYFELFTNAILLSTITAAVAIVAEDATGTEGISSTTSAEGTTTQSGKPSDFALMDGINNLGEITKGIASDLLKTKPTITVDQGTRIKVFVNRDLIFPSSVASNVKFVK